MHAKTQSDVVHCFHEYNIEKCKIDKIKNVDIEGRNSSTRVKWWV